MTINRGSRLVYLTYLDLVLLHFLRFLFSFEKRNIIPVYEFKVEISEEDSIDELSFENSDIKER